MLIQFDRIHKRCGRTDGRMNGQTSHDGRGHAYAQHRETNMYTYWNTTICLLVSTTETVSVIVHSDMLFQQSLTACRLMLQLHSLSSSVVSNLTFTLLVYKWPAAQFTSSSHMRVINHNWSATKQRLHPQTVAEISRHSVLSGDRIRQCETSSGSCHKDTDQCL